VKCGFWEAKNLKAYLREERKLNNRSTRASKIILILDPKKK
jgi:hypothetical protein